MPRPRKPDSPFRYFNSSPEVIRLVVLLYVRYPLSLRNVEDLLFDALQAWLRDKGHAPRIVTLETAQRADGVVTT